MIGYEIVEWNGMPWRRVHGAMLPLTPPHAQTAVDPAEARRWVRAQRAHFARWEVEFESAVPTEWWHVVKDGAHDLDSLPKKVRYLVRQGRKLYAIAPCRRADIVAEGHDVYRRAYERYDTFEPCLPRDRFVQEIEAMPDGIEFWCARDLSGGAMVAFAENVVADDACFYSTMWFCPEALKNGVSYALVQGMNEHYLGERGFRYVSDGARNLSHKTNIHEFLQSKFGFHKAYCRLRVAYSTPVQWLVRLTWPLRAILPRLPGLARLGVLLEQERIRRACELP